MTKEKFFTAMGWVGMVTAVLMYVFYLPQIESNLAGNKGSFIQPFMAGVNCTLWVAYGLFKEKRDWPVAIANTPGIIFGFVAAFTALLVQNNIKCASSSFFRVKRIFLLWLKISRITLSYAKLLLSLA